jgi:hypothetical protein
MPLNADLLYGLMAVNFLAHIALAWFIYLIIMRMSFFDNMSIKMRIYSSFGLLIVGSYILNFLMLLGLQVDGCGGLQDAVAIAKGSFVASIITAGMASVPVFVEAMRLIVSQLFVTHKALLTPELKAFQMRAEETAQSMIQKPGADALLTPASLDSTSDIPQKSETVVPLRPAIAVGGAYEKPESKFIATEKDFDTQTFTETAIGSAYWSAFAGAFGVAIGSVTAVSC